MRGLQRIFDAPKLPHKLLADMDIQRDTSCNVKRFASICFVKSVPRLPPGLATDIFTASRYLGVTQGHGSGFGHL